MTTGTFALCRQVCSWNSLEDRRYGTAIFHEIWMKIKGRIRDKQENQKLFQVETPFEALKLPVPNPATVSVWLVWRIEFQMDWKLWETHCTLKHFPVCLEGQVTWPTVEQWMKKPGPLEAQMVSWFHVKHWEAKSPGKDHRWSQEHKFNANYSEVEFNWQSQHCFVRSNSDSPC